jgi:hypothetical protein
MSIIRLGTSIVNLFLNYEKTYLFCLKISQRIFYSFLNFFIKVGKLGYNLFIGIYLLVFLGCIIQLATMMPSAISSIISYFSRVRIDWLRFTLFGITIHIPTLNLARKAGMNRKDKEKSNKQKQTLRRLFLKQAKKTSKFTFLKRYKLMKIDKITRLRILRNRLFKNRIKKDESNEDSTNESS